MSWIFWIIELLLPATMVLFGILAAKKSCEKTGTALLGAGFLLGVLTYAVKKWQPLAPAVQSMVVVGVQLVVFVVVILFVQRNMKGE